MMSNTVIKEMAFFPDGMTAQNALLDTFSVRIVKSPLSDQYFVFYQDWAYNFAQSTWGPMTGIQPADLTTDFITAQELAMKEADFIGTLGLDWQAGEPHDVKEGLTHAK